jgi:hypothetical protein
MNPTLTAAGLALLGLCGGPAADPAAPTAPTVVRWPGGGVTVNGPEAVVRRQTAAGRSLNVVTGSGNGFGNTVVVDDGGGGGLTVVRNARNGVGNRLVLDPDDVLLELPPPRLDLPPPAEPVYKGRDAKFWTKKVWSESYDCNLYWCPEYARWFRYDRGDDAYRPVPGDYDPAADGP